MPPWPSHVTRLRGGGWEMAGLLGLKVLTLATWCCGVGHSGVDFLPAEHRTIPTPTFPSARLKPKPASRLGRGKAGASRTLQSVALVVDFPPPTP